MVNESYFFLLSGMKPSFSSLPVPKPDPLFAIAAEAAKAGPDSINGTLGIYMDEEGNPMVFPSVMSVIVHLEKHLHAFNYSYPLLTGLPKYRDAVTELLSPGGKDIVASMATTGGTGALAVNLRLMKTLLGDATNIILPVPAWANHAPPCRGAGLNVVECPYVLNGRASVDAIIDTARKQEGPFGLLLQIGCHNPTGLDLSDRDVRELVGVLQSMPCVALLDFAYQGFKNTPEEDIAPVRLFTDAGITTLVTWSASKNHCIYGLRTGLAAAFVGSESERQTVEGTYSGITRGLHSAAPTFGQAIVALVHQRCPDVWREDLAEARRVMAKKRKTMIQSLPSSFTDALTGFGMFAMLPLTPEQVDRLKTEHQVYLPRDGRLNIAGIPEARIAELCRRIEKVL